MIYQAQVYQAQVAIGELLPVQLVLLSTGSLVFIRVAKVGTIVDQVPDNGIRAIFTDEHFQIGDEEFWYNTIYQYKEIPGMLQWLKQQNMVLPEFK